MKKALVILALSAACIAQGPNSNNLNGGMAIPFPGAPTGSCAGTQTAVNTSNGNLYTCNSGSWSAVSSSVTFPQSAPVNCTTIPYSFSGATSDGVCDLSRQLELFADSGIGGFFGRSTDVGGTGIAEWYVSAAQGTNNNAVVEMFSGELSQQTQYRIVDVGATAVPANVGDFEIRASQFLSPGQYPVFRIEHEDASVVMDATGAPGSTPGPLRIRSGSTSSGQRSTNETAIWQNTAVGDTISSISFAKALRIDAQQTASNTGNVLINQLCQFDNTASSSGHFAFSCSVPKNGTQASSIAVLTNDGTPFNGTGMLWMDADDSGGFTRLEADNDTGAKFFFYNHNESTKFAQVQFDSNGITTTGLTNCTSSASPAVCGAKPQGFVNIAASASTVQVNSSAVTANSIIQVTFDETLGTALAVTCNTASASEGATYFVSARTAGTSFTIKTNTAPTTNPACLSYTIYN